MPYTAKLNVRVSRAFSRKCSSSGTSLGRTKVSRPRWVGLAVSDGFTPGEVGKQLDESRGVVQFIEYLAGPGLEDQGTALFVFLEVLGPPTKSGLWVSGVHVATSDSGYDKFVRC